MNQDYLLSKLHENVIPTRVLLARARLTKTSDWETPIMNDPKYIPFYYHLGGQVNAKCVFELGFDLGLTASAFVQGCSTIEEYYGFQFTNDDFYYSPRLGVATLKEYYSGSINIHAGNYSEYEKFVSTKNWDLVLYTQKTDPKFLKRNLDKSWEQLKVDGYLIVDHLFEKDHMEHFEQWCIGKNLNPIIYSTRNILGIVKKKV